MQIPDRRRVLEMAGRAALAGLLLPLGAGAQTATPSGRPSVVVQVSDADPARWNLVLNNLRNLQAELGSQAGEVELVAFGPGLGVLKADSPVGARVADALKSGIKVVACQNTMRAQQLQPADMLPGIGYVPSGVTEIVRQQQKGWAYLRP